MADNDYNMIKPVESLQNVGGLTPVKQRKERNRRRKHQQKPEDDEQQPTESLDENYQEKIPKDQSDRHSIDYCA